MMQINGVDSFVARFMVSHETVNTAGAAETFSATNGGSAPGTKIASINAVSGKFLIPIAIRVTITGTANTNVFATVRLVTSAGANRDCTEATATNATPKILNMRACMAAGGAIFVSPIFDTVELITGFVNLLTDGDQIAKIEIYARRDNTTDAVAWTAEIMAMQVG